MPLHSQLRQAKLFHDQLGAQRSCRSSLGSETGYLKNVVNLMEGGVLDDGIGEMMSLMFTLTAQDPSNRFKMQEDS